jgi:hypothetical protein
MNEELKAVYMIMGTMVVGSGALLMMAYATRDKLQRMNQKEREEKMNKSELESLLISMSPREREQAIRAYDLLSALPKTAQEEILERYDHGDVQDSSLRQAGPCAGSPRPSVMY